MHRYRIIHVYDASYAGRNVIETSIGATQGIPLLDALSTIARLSNGIMSLGQTTDENIIKVEGAECWGHYNLVRVSE